MGCLVCGGTDFDALKSVKWHISGVGAVPVHFALCRDCGHIQQYPLPPHHVITAFYAELSNYTKLETTVSLPSVPEEATTYRLLDIARRYSVASAYEIGCGSGAHLGWLQRAGVTVSGNELSPAAGRQSEHLIGAAIDIGAAEDVVPQQADQDMVILSHVLEHVPDLASLLRVARGTVSDAGILALEVPCARQAHHICSGWLAMEHLSYFSENVLIQVIEQAGFDIVETLIDDTSHVYPTIMVVARPVAPTTFQGKAYPNDYHQNRLLMDQVLKDDKAHWGSVSQAFEGLETCYIWAAGVHTSQLFAETPLLDTVTVKGVVDSSTLKQGKEIGGFPILSPDMFEAHYDGEPVIISSLVSQRAIHKALLEKGLADEKIIRLYPDDAGKKDFS